MEFREAITGKSKEEVLSEIRRKSAGFARGKAQFRGVSVHKHGNSFEARIRRAHSGKTIYLGLFPTAEEAARAYDRACVALSGKGSSTMLNFPLSDYDFVLLEPRKYLPKQCKKDLDSFEKSSATAPVIGRTSKRRRSCVQDCSPSEARCRADESDSLDGVAPLNADSNEALKANVSMKSGEVNGNVGSVPSRAGAHDRGGLQTCLMNDTSDFAAIGCNQAKLGTFII